MVQVIFSRGVQAPFNLLKSNNSLWWLNDNNRESFRNNLLSAPDKWFPMWLTNFVDDRFFHVLCFCPTSLCMYSCKDISTIWFPIPIKSHFCEIQRYLVCQFVLRRSINKPLICNRWQIRKLCFNTIVNILSPDGRAPLCGNHVRIPFMCRTDTCTVYNIDWSSVKSSHIHIREIS